MTARTLVVVCLGYGLLQLSAPNLMSTRVLGQPLRRRDRAVLRLLGARHLLQAAVTTAMPTPPVRRCGASVDAAHAASMLCAPFHPGRRRTAVAETVCASGFTIAGLQAARRVDRPLSGRGATTT